MKKIICILLVFILSISCVACNTATDDTNTPPVDDTPTEVILTTANITDYLNFDGEFVDGSYENNILFYVAEAMLEFQAYPIASGTFNNVEITLIATSTDSAFTCASLGEKWHLSTATEEDEDNIKLNIKLGFDGKFSKNYKVTCDRCTGILEGGANFKVVSVSGTFTPNK